MTFAQRPESSGRRTFHAERGPAAFSGIELGMFKKQKQVYEQGLKNNDVQMGIKAKWLPRTWPVFLHETGPGLESLNQSLGCQDIEISQRKNRIVSK